MNTNSYILIFLLHVTPTVFSQTIEINEAVLSFEDTTCVDVTKNVNDVEVPFWSTTANDGLIELWVDGTEDISASDGKYFVELNANEIASLYFDVRTQGFDTLKLSLDHRARLSGGYDEIEIRSGSTQNILKSHGNFKSNSQKWNTHSLNIPIEKDQDLTRIQIQGVSTVSNDPTVGNFIDNVRLSLTKSEIKPEAVSIKLYPNPFVDYIVFDAENSESIFELSIYNMQGELQKQKQVTSQSKINLNELKTGLFLVNILDTSTKNITQTRVSKH